MRSFTPALLAVIAAFTQAATAATINVPGDAATIQGGINLALAGDEVVVAPGTYMEYINFNGKAITLRSSNPLDPATVAATIINAGGTSRPVTCNTGETLATVLDGFTLTGGNPSNASGGGMLIDHADATVTHCVFTGNAAPISGGAIAATNSSPVITNCSFIANTSIGNGGAISNTFGGATIVDCVFIGNASTISSGGAIWAGLSNLVVVNCALSGNSCGADGGAMYILADVETPSVTNCTFSSNTAGGSGDGLFADANSGQLSVTNCIMRNGGADEIFINSGVTIVSYSNVQGGFAGVGNIDADPLFVDADGADDIVGTSDDDLRLAAYSPCADAGDNTASGLSGVSEDLAGLPRFVDDGNVADTGVGTPPLVDMGAYERQEDSHRVLVLNPSDSIQAAIDDPLTRDGDVIILNPGRYNEAINLRGKAITIQSTHPEYANSDTSLYGGGLGNGTNLITCDSGETVGTVIKGLFLATHYSAKTRGMLNDGASPTVANCKFASLQTAENGGAIYNANGSSPTVIGCAFEGNFVSFYGTGGGAIANFNDSSPLITDCTFTANIVEGGGGGIYSDMNCSPIVTGCSFVNNLALSGGGVESQEGGLTTLINCTFDGNEALGGGGVALFTGSDATISNCVFIGNKAYDLSGTPPNANYGGAVFCPDDHVTITNSTFTGNTAVDSGGAVYVNINGGNATLTNCILWGDGTNEIAGGGAITVSHSIVQGGYAGVGVIDADPRFLSDDDLRLGGCSPAIDAGDNTAAQSVGLTADLNGAPRFVDDANIMDTGVGDAPIVDMGAYERQEDTSLYVELTPADSVPRAIDLACPGVVIVLAEGTYHEAISPHGDITLRSMDPNDPDVVAATILDGTGLGTSIITCDSGATASTKIVGLTIANAATTGNGGGMHNIAGSPTVDRCVFRNNSASVGGAMYSESGSAPTLINCKIIGNNADLLGGGIGNSASSPTLVNCTVSGNVAAVGGGGMHNINSSNPTVTNCILWGDSPDEIADFSSSVSTATYSVIAGGHPGVGNINADPHFVDAANDDYRLAAGSPAIDAGDNTAVPDGTTTDLDGNLRFFDDIGTPDSGHADPSDPDLPLVDMGAYEFQGQSLAGDLDHDGDVDIDDFVIFSDCLTGPANGLPMGCAAADLDRNGDVDMADVAEFQRSFTGPQP